MNHLAVRSFVTDFSQIFEGDRDTQGSLPNFDPVSMPEKCCNRPKIVAIAEIATLFFSVGRRCRRLRG